MTKSQITKVLKTAAYVGVSAVLGYLIAWVEGHPEAFGVYSGLVNVLLVTIRQLISTGDGKEA